MTARTVGVAAVLIGLVGLASCGTSGVTASTTCSDFLAMDGQTQQTGVQQLATKTHGSAYKGPMGIMNLVYNCQYSPHATLGHVMGIS